MAGTRAQAGRKAAAEWLQANADALDGWFDGVTMFDGAPAPRPAEAQAATSVPRGAGGFEAWVASHKIPLGPAVESAIDFIKANGKGFFAGISTVIQGSIGAVNALLSGTPGLLIGWSRGEWLLHARSARRFLIAALPHHEQGTGGDARDAALGSSPHSSRRCRRADGIAAATPAAAVRGAPPGARPVQTLRT